MEPVALLLGVALGVVIVMAAYFLFAPVLRSVEQFVVSKLRGSRAPRVPLPALIAVFVVVSALASPYVSFAQNATPVPLNIPVNAIFTETNNWMETFAPIAAIGIGITLALAVLGYIGKIIASAFR
jgi:hypothetical protein